MRIIRSWQLIALCSVMFLATACSDDDKTVTEDDSNEKKVLIGATSMNPDGYSGSSYIQLIANTESAYYDNQTALPISFGVIPILYKDWVFEAPIYGEKGTLEKYERTDEGTLVQSGSLQLTSGAQGAQMAFVSDEKAYLSIWNQGKIIVLNPTTMEQLSVIDVSEYGIGDEDPNPTCMVIRDGKLFVTLAQLVGGYFPDANRPYTDVLIIDTNTDKPEKMITEKTSGFSYPSRPLDDKSVFMDEDGDIYMICLGIYGTADAKLGILRIKNGETEFDSDYIFTLSETAIDGDPNTPDVLYGVQYAGNGKLYAIAQIYAYHSNPPSFLNDRTTLAVEIDLKSKTIKKLPDLPRGNGFGSIGIYNGKIVVGIASDNSKGYHIYDPSTGTATSEPVITVEGEPTCFRHFGEEF